MSDSDDCAPILVKGKNEDGRNSYTKYEPNGVKVRDTARKSTGGATPRKVIVSKRPVAVVVTEKRKISILLPFRGGSEFCIDF